MPFDAEPLKFGDIVLVPFPFTDQSATKRRPAVVISRLGYNRQHPDTILMPVTSQIRGDERPGDIVVTQWKLANLLKPSAIKPVIATIETTLVIRRLRDTCCR
jgi:mRNA interferase MazF